MSVRTAFLPILDKYRGMLDTVWDLRRYDVVVRINTWTPGTLPGAQGSTKGPVDTPLLVNGGRVKVEQLTQRDIIASGGLYQDQDLKIGPLTPPYTNAQGLPAGTNPTVFDPVISGSNTEVLFKITGPGYPTGAWFKKIGQELPKANFAYYLIVRKTAAQHV
ncbi:hypothetical protein WMF27_20545 [Sorangium sp. So ce281]|uniref:hypothetical protein n=1 Tax=unclassified Sorangium TaxID=2621164 RepID=UPI003F603D25